MKLLRLLAGALICAFILNFSSAQSFALSWAQSYGLGSYDTNGRPAADPFYASGIDVPLAVAKMPDGGFVVAGYLAMPNVWRTGGSSGTRGWLGALVRYAADGTILWQTLLRQDNDLYQNGFTYHALNNIGQMATDAQGNIFVCGSKFGNGLTTNFTRGFVAKFSPEGALLWQNGFKAGSATVGNPPQVVPLGTGAINYLSLTSDGGVLVTCAQSRPGSSYAIPVLAKFNADGSLAFTKAYDNGIQYLGSTPVCQSQDGSRYVMAFEYDTDGSTPGMRYGLLLLVTDTAGNIVAQRAYDHADNSGEHPVAIIATNDGNFATLSKLGDNVGFLLRKLNNDLSAEILEKRVTRTGGGFLAGNSLIETNDGGFLIGSATNNPHGINGTDVLLFKIDSAGDFVFASILGGPSYEGYNFGGASSIALELNDGTYGFAATSASYHTGGPVSGSYHLPDWWIAKTDANRKVRNFHDVMEDMSSSLFNITGSPQVAEGFSPFSLPNYPYSLTTTSQPSFVLENLALETSPDLPTLMIQAAGPRILSDHNVEAIVEQHFSYHIVTAYFPAGSQITYSATGLPADFVLDPQTGTISGIAHVGSETVENDLPPIQITLHATDGIDTADGVIDLAISDGAPLFAVTPVSTQANPVLSFTCLHLGKQAGRIMNVEYMAPDLPGVWRWLDNGSNGYMTFDTSSSHYVLNSTSYPQQNGVRFRARLTVQGRDALISNEVGPFDLASGTARAGKTLLSLIRNGIRADFDFRATQSSSVPGVAMRVQSTTTPSAEGTWTDLQNTGSGQMTEDAQSHVFTHTSNNIPAVNGLYFRAVAKLSGSIDSLSNIIGPYNLITDQPPQVSLTRPSGGTGSGTEDDPAIYSVDDNGSLTLHLAGSATSNRQIEELSILIDGTPIQTVSAGATSVSIDYTTTRTGPRTIEVLAIDDLGASARAGTGSLFIDVRSNDASGQSARSGRVRTNGVASTGKTFYVAVDGGIWSDPNTWLDTHGAHGIPGADDTAYVDDDKSVTFPAYDIPVKVLGISRGGKLIGPGILNIVQGMVITRGEIAGNLQVDIGPDAIVTMTNKTDFQLDGSVTNRGKWLMRGVGGLKGVHSFNNKGISEFQMPLLQPADVTAGLAAVPRVLSTGSFLNSGQIAVTGIISTNGGGIVAQGGGNIVAQGGGNLVNPGGGAIVAQGGGNIVAQGGGNIVAQGGGNIVAQGGGNVAVQQGSCLISQDGASIVAQGGGNIISTNGGGIVAQGGGNIVAQGGGNRPSAARQTRNAPTVVVPADFVQTDGQIDLNFVTITADVDVQGGLVSGSGMIDGNLSMNGGYISPGHSSGQVVVSGDYNQSSASTMIVEAGGGEPGQFDVVQVGAHANLAGALQFHTLNGFAPLPDDPFNPIGYASLDGNFEYSSPNGQLSVNSNGMLLVLQPTATNPLTLTSAVSRKVHGAAGPYDIPLPLSGQPGVECRSSGGQHTIVFFFSNNITSAGASLDSATGNVNGTPAISANTVTVNLSGIADAQQISVSLQGVIDEFGQMLPDITVPMDTLIGDVSGNGTVNGTDVSQTKIQSGAAVTNANFREDVNLNGGINGTDVSIVKLHSGTGISAAPR